MKAIVSLTALLACIAFAGCQGTQEKQIRLGQLQADYKIANKQYNDDCVAPAYGAKGAEAYFKGTTPKVPTPQEEASQNQKCAQELRQVTALDQQITAMQK